MIINRELLSIKMKNSPIASKKIEEQSEKIKNLYGLSEEETEYFVFTGKIGNRAYNSEFQNINILKKDGRLKDVAKASDHLNLKTFSKKVIKYYMCYPKEPI